jgi:hypothetical protein
MKKIVLSPLLLLATLFSNAQQFNPAQLTDSFNAEIFRICASIFTVIAFMVFIVAILKMFMENRLKHKIVDKGVSDTIASSILQATPQNDKNLNIKWFAILAGIGAGLMIVNYTQPLGIHSIAIMSFSISASFLGYYFFTRKLYS